MRRASSTHCRCARTATGSAICSASSSSTIRVSCGTSRQMTAVLDTDHGGVGQQGAAHRRVRSRLETQRQQPDDGNINTFRKALADLSAADAQVRYRVQRRREAGSRRLSRLARRIGQRSVGEGASRSGNARDTAHKVGHGSVTEVLGPTRASSERDEEPVSSRTTTRASWVVGHSFGGAVVYAAVGQLLGDRFVAHEGAGRRAIERCRLRGSRGADRSRVRRRCCSAP